MVLKLIVEEYKNPMFDNKYLYNMDLHVTFTGTNPPDSETIVVVLDDQNEKTERARMETEERLEYDRRRKNIGDVQ